MLQTVEDAFRSAPNGAAPYNVADWIATVAGGPTLGATLIDQTDPIGPVSVHGPAPQVLGFTVSGGMLLDGWNRGSAPGAAYGKFGKVRVGLARYASVTRPGVAAQTFGGYYASSALDLPADSFGIADLWDPAIDRLPPSFYEVNGAPIVLPVTAEIQLPTPVPVLQGQRLYVGIWIAPSLLSAGATPFTTPAPCVVPTVMGARYQVRYDDGR